MGAHIIDGEFQSDKYPTCPRGKVPLSVKDKTAQDLLWEYAQRRRSVDAEFADDLETALKAQGYAPHETVAGLKDVLEILGRADDGQEDHKPIVLHMTAGNARGLKEYIELTQIMLNYLYRQLDAANSIIKELRQENYWQPADTAPRCVPSTIGDNGRRPVLITHFPHTGNYAPVFIATKHKDGKWTTSGRRKLPWQPTHWRYIPKVMFEEHPK